MATDASRDQNFVPTLLAVSSADGSTTVPVYANPTTHRLLTDAGTGITGPGSSTDNAIVRFDGTTGAAVKNSQIVVNDSGLITTYGNVTTAGWGVPAVYANARLTAQTAAVASIATYTVGASDGSFLVSGNVLVTAYTSGNFTLQGAYTNEAGTAISAAINGHFTSGYTTTISGAGSVEMQLMQIRAKAGTTITLKTVGTFTNLTYNVEGTIMQIA